MQTCFYFYITINKRQFLSKCPVRHGKRPAGGHELAELVAELLEPLGQVVRLVENATVVAARVVPPLVAVHFFNQLPAQFLQRLLV
jgi:hypothetical protein